MYMENGTHWMRAPVFDLHTLAGDGFTFLGVEREDGAPFDGVLELRIDGHIHPIDPATELHLPLFRLRDVACCLYVTSAHLVRVRYCMCYLPSEELEALRRSNSVCSIKRGDGSLLTFCMCDGTVFIVRRHGVGCS